MVRFSPVAEFIQPKETVHEIEEEEEEESAITDNTAAVARIFSGDIGRQNKQRMSQ